MEASPPLPPRGGVPAGARAGLSTWILIDLPLREELPQARGHPQLHALRPLWGPAPQDFHRPLPDLQGAGRLAAHRQ